MKKSILTLAIAATTITALPVLAANAQISTALNGVEISLGGTFYHPAKNSNMVQESTPVIKFSGVNKQGGIDIVNGYTIEFGKELYKETIADKLSELSERLTPIQLSDIAATRNEMQEKFPQVMDFYAGIAEATGYTLNDVYMAAWASDGMFALNIAEALGGALPELKAAVEDIRGCTSAGFDNGIVGQNQDMPISISGYGAIWKSDTIIVNAPEPFFTAISMTREVATTINSDTLTTADIGGTLPTSGVALGSILNATSAIEAADAIKSHNLNSASAFTMTDLQGNALTLEVHKDGNEIFFAENGGIGHSNHPRGKEQYYADIWTGGDTTLLSNALKDSFWRTDAALNYTKFAPDQSVDALKDLFQQRPIYKVPQDGDEFVSINTIIHDLTEGCSYGTTWLIEAQGLTKVCFD